MGTGPTNYQLKVLLQKIQGRTQESPFWRRIQKDLCKPSRQRRTVNVYIIDKFAQDGETIVVPGKVLSVGDLHKKVTVAAVNFSSEARRKIIAAQGRTLSLQELWEQNPQGKKVRILG